MKTCAHLFGAPRDVIPETFADFRSYMAGMLDGGDLCVTPIARDIARSVMHPPLPLPLRPAMQWSNLVTAALMPEHLRRDYGLAWDPARAALATGSREWTRRIAMRLLPDRLRTVPASRP
jgi:uncharacterized protein (DUF2236 family)